MFGDRRRHWSYFLCKTRSSEQKPTQTCCNSPVDFHLIFPCLYAWLMRMPPFIKSPLTGSQLTVYYKRLHTRTCVPGAAAPTHGSLISLNAAWSRVIRSALGSSIMSCGGDGGALSSPPLSTFMVEWKHCAAVIPAAFLCSLRAVREEILSLLTGVCATAA